MEAVARHRKWSSRYIVRKALVANPATPHVIAHRLVATLLKQDLKELRNFGVLTPSLNERVEQILKISAPCVPKNNEHLQIEEQDSGQEIEWDALFNEVEQHLKTIPTAQSINAAPDDHQGASTELSDSTLEDVVIVDPLEEELPEDLEELQSLADEAEQLLIGAVLVPVQDD